MKLPVQPCLPVKGMERIPPLPATSSSSALSPAEHTHVPLHDQSQQTPSTALIQEPRSARHPARPARRAYRRATAPTPPHAAAWPRRRRSRRRRRPSWCWWRTPPCRRCGCSPSLEESLGAVVQTAGGLVLSSNVAAGGSRQACGHLRRRLRRRLLFVGAVMPVVALVVGVVVVMYGLPVSGRGGSPAVVGDVVCPACSPARRRPPAGPYTRRASRTSGAVSPVPYRSQAGSSRPEDRRSCHCHYRGSPSWPCCRVAGRHLWYLGRRRCCVWYIGSLLRCRGCAGWRRGWAAGRHRPEASHLG